MINVLPRGYSSFDIQELFYILTIDSATEFLFGESTGSLHTYGSHTASTVVRSSAGFAEAFNTSQKYLLRRVLAQRLYWTINPSKFRNANAQVHEVVNHYVQLALLSKHADKTQKVGHGHGQGRYVFLEALASETDDPKLIRDNLLNVLLAGRDTTASLLSSVFYFLARNSRVWEKLRREVVGEFGDRRRRGNGITHARVKDLTYLRYVLNESESVILTQESARLTLLALRLLPPVPVNFRQALKDTSLPVGGGQARNAPIYIEKGDIVGYNVYAMHRRTDIWGADAHTFRPERWAENPPRGWEYLPFNGGPRICLGREPPFSGLYHRSVIPDVPNRTIRPGRG